MIEPALPCGCWKLFPAVSQTLLKLFDCQAGILIYFKMDSLAILKT
jgi:hypothetical protein